MQHGPHWKILRRFTLRALRDFGLGKSSLEEKVKDEVDIVLAELDDLKGKPLNPQKLLMKSVTNIICSIIFGHRSVSIYVFIIYLIKGSYYVHMCVTVFWDRYFLL